MEKAHQGVINVFLQILDDSRLADMILAGEALPGQKVVLDSKGDAFTLKARSARG